MIPPLIFYKKPKPTSRWWVKQKSQKQSCMNDEEKTATSRRVSLPLRSNVVPKRRLSWVWSVKEDGLLGWCVCAQNRWSCHVAIKRFPDVRDPSPLDPIDQHLPNQPCYNFTPQNKNLCFPTFLCSKSNLNIMLVCFITFQNPRYHCLVIIFQSPT